MDTLSTLLFTPVAGAWMGLFVALALFSIILGDQGLARFAQHVLVGGALGYAALMAVREVLEPRLLLALQTGAGSGWLWVPLGLGLLLWLAGLDALRTPAEHSSAHAALLRPLLRLLGVRPVPVMMGVGVTVGLLGVWQGTLLPQMMVALRTQVDGGAPPSGWMTPLLTLMLTTAALLALTGQGSQERAPRPIQMLLGGWRWVGQRALWLAAGVLFARLAASRISLFSGWVEFVNRSVQQTGIWRWFE